MGNTMAEAPKKYIVSHIKSRETTDKELIDEGYPSMSDKMAKRPDTNELVNGQIAVNYAKGHETLSIRSVEVDDNGYIVDSEIVGFLSEKVTYENEKIVASAIANLQDDTITKFANLQDDIRETILEEELITASSIANLEKKKAERSELYELKNDATMNCYENELITASAIAAIIGKTHGYINGGVVSNGHDLSLNTLNGRIDFTQSNIEMLIERVTALEDTITADDIKKMAGLL